MINTFLLKLRKTFPNIYQELLNIKQGRYNYSFSEEKYPGSFLNTTQGGGDIEQKVPEIIYCFWTGNNEMSENRKKGLQTLQKNSGIPVKLITPENLNEYIKEDAPLHKGYNLLTLTMKSDYLRCYFMHHYGGGYADIKPFEHSWQSAFKKLNSKKDKYIIGYPELLYGGIAPAKHRFLSETSFYTYYEDKLNIENKIYKDLMKYTPLLIGNCSFVCKPYSPITTEWYNEVNRRMDELCDYTSKFCKKENLEIPYFYLVQIFHPLILKYHKYILRDKNLLPILKNYR